MSENQTRPQPTDPRGFLKAISNDRRRADGLALLELMETETDLPAVMWGPSMIGFGTYHYRYESGREGDMFVVGFSPRASSLSLYVFGGQEQYADLLATLGKHKTGKSCIYITRLDDVDLDVVREMIDRSFQMATQLDN